jgi:hypothetical protein
MEPASRRRLLLASLAVGAVVALAAVTLVRCNGRPPPAQLPESFSFDDVAAASPDLPLVIDSVRGTLRESYMDWACLLRCEQPEGCHADLRLTVHYESAGAGEQIIFHGTIDLVEGSRARFGGVQRPARPVDRITRVEVEVLRTFQPGDPVPTPEL